MFVLPDLPYPYDALEPVMSDRTLRFHHDKHHAAYVKTLNELIETAGKSRDTLEQVIVEASTSEDRKLFNNAAQAWNHSFFWAAMSPERAHPTGELASAINSDFGDLDRLRGLSSAKASVTSAPAGSGWRPTAADPCGYARHTTPMTP